MRRPRHRAGLSGIRSPYAGTNSLPGGGQTRETWTTDAFLGWRLWQGGEFYFNPELAQGFGLNSTLGLAGFSNGEAQKGGATYPRFRPQRYIFRQTFGLGGEQEDVADGPIQLAGKRDIDRVTLTLGRFAVGDFFDGNAYAKDPRVDFMNWAMWSSAAYDFPADLPGFTRGAVVEFNRKDWAVRAGLFQVPSAPNSDVLIFKTGGSVIEFEERHTIFDQPGKLRLGIFANRGNTGNYRDALAIEAADPALDINDVIVDIRRDNPNTAFTSTPNNSLRRMSACSLVPAGMTARTKSCRLRISTAAFRRACRSRAAIGAGQTIRSVLAAPSMACRARIATSSPPAGSAC